MMPDTVVTWKWKSEPGYRSVFGPETVNTLFRMVRRHYQHPFRPICITDDAEGIDPDVEIVPLWPDFGDVPSPHGTRRGPSCYRRLKAFSVEAENILSSRRFVSLDLDCVVTGDLTALWHRPEDFVVWGDTAPTALYNGSMWLMTAGARRKVWETFDPVESPKRALRSGRFGSDQGWLSYCLGPGEAMWSTADGVYSYRNHVQKQQDRLPTDARIVFFHGHIDPWDKAGQRIPWVREYYQ